MRLSVRILILCLCAFGLMTQYQNCSSSSQNTLFESSNLPTTTTAVSDPGKPSIQVSSLVSPLVADAIDNQISVAGTCNVAGRKFNYIQYSVVEPISKRSLNLSVGTSPIYALRDAICENGKFYIVLPLANTNQGGPSIGSLSYLLNAELYVSNVEGAYEPKITTSATLQITSQ